MTSNQNIINLSSDSSDSSESLMSPPPLRMPTLPRGLTKEQAKKRKQDVPIPANSSSSSLPPYPSEIDDPKYQKEMQRQWNAMERAKRVPTPEEASSKSTSSDEEDDDEDDDLYSPNMPEKPQSSCPRRPRRRRLNPPLPAARKIVLGLPCIQRQIVSCSNNKGKEKAVEGKGKAKVE